jgi:fatty-acyl-CoA synthase
MEWNYGDALDQVGKIVPENRPAIIFGDQVISWSDFNFRVNNLARAFVDLGLKPGDRIGIMSRNHPSYLEVVAAAFKARLVFANINYRYQADEVEHILSDCAASALVFQDEYYDLSVEVMAKLDHLKVAISIDTDHARALPLNIKDIDQLAEYGDGEPLDIARSSDDGFLLYTGGTTGKPKGVMWRSCDVRQIQLEQSVIKGPKPATLDEHLELVKANKTPGRVIPAAPLMHGAGINASLSELASGGTVLLLKDTRFNPEELWSLVDQHKGSRILIVGDAFARPMLEALDAEPNRWDVSSIKLISSAGLMWSTENKAGLLKHMPNALFLDILGSSEAAGLGYGVTTKANAMPTGYFEPGPHTVLVATDYSRVFDDDEIGEGWIARRPPFASGYFGDEKKSAEVYRSINGEFLAIPGDLAVREADGNLRLLGRGNVCINSGGEKVHPEEVEEALKLIDGIDDALVVGVPSPKWGQSVIALIQTKGTVDEGLISAQLKKAIAPYKVPKSYVRTSAMPRHDNGKSNYRLAVEMAKEHVLKETGVS